MDWVRNLKTPNRSAWYNKKTKELITMVKLVGPDNWQVAYKNNVYYFNSRFNAAMKISDIIHKTNYSKKRRGWYGDSRGHKIAAMKRKRNR